MKPKLRDGVGRQFAALPCKLEGGQTFVMLVTSRDTGRWVLPKGWAERGLSGAQLAAKEAFEEAGVVGVTTGKSIGAYHYSKQLPEGRAIECRVNVFPIRVIEVLDTWPEASERRREWFTPEQAAASVNEAELAGMLALVALPDA